ncbi:uncharacterized protein SPAPADRAFT_58681 [Spathaspora passalidarum NRRL Y-27907]|uniref:Thioredoxin domain-containing protein n=1 Tax=Spathaspora passalidarum (strain NRRL Y-27907 / 11-Y1) TaxID=619300 RepID=G3AH16_SPAPN|nr:uncharacterized protein SPAPADRAFT_58681 [Spathaspora passalidarum NRRL Y-27907]EGW35446.1 hypothetical protein SPAPADRAFT_58681 [Spathaspora passalidarum NRRL Y-27907]
MSGKFPTNINPKYIPYTKLHDGVLSCDVPVELNLANTFKGKKVVVTAVPGAFTPTCTEQHIPDYLKNLAEFKKKGIDKIVVLSANDPFVMAAWGKALGYRDEENYIVFATDPNATISKQLGDNYVADLSAVGFGLRLQRYAALVEDGEIKYLGNEDELGFTEISSAKNLLDQI